ncbi:MAG TPA: hypothetical protein PLV42_06725 [bacterium]|nr:hypothetical protein [bacterium]
MKYRKILLTIFWPSFILFTASAIASFASVDWAQLSAADLHKLATMIVAVVALISALLLIIASRSVYFEHAEMEKQTRDLPQIIQRLQAEITTKDALLAREKEILFAKHQKLEEAFNTQKRANADLDKLRRDYENIIALNKTVWFMDNALGIIELIAEESIKAVDADRAVILINDQRGAVSVIGTTVATEEQRGPLKKLFGATAFNRNLTTMLNNERFIRLDRQVVPQPIAEFLSCGHGADCFAFPVRFHKDLRGAAFIATRRDSGLIVKNLTLLEMFFSIVAVYLERNELIGKEHEFDDIISEQEKMMSITHLTEGIAHNINSPLNTIMLSHELVENVMNSLASKYPDEMLVERLRKTTDRIHKAAETINGIVSNISTKASQDKVEKPDYMDLNGIIRAELTFLEADMEFKHDYEKVVELAENLPVIHGIYRDFSYIVDAHIYLAMHFLKNEDPRKILFRTQHDEGGVLFEIGLSGGIDGDTLEKIFAGNDKQHIARVNIPTLNKTLEQNNILRSITEDKEFVIVMMHIPVKA